MNQDLLVVDNLARHYVVGQGWFKAKGVVKALDGVSFSLAPSRTLAIVGESGCGKSTLARQLTLVERPTSGSISLSGVDAAGADRQQLRSLRQQVQMVFQNPFASLNPRKSIAATLDEPLRINTALDAQERREKVDSVVGRVGLPARAPAPLSPHVLRRAAPAHRHCASDDAVAAPRWWPTSRRPPWTSRCRPRS